MKITDIKTFLVGAGGRARVDEYGFLWITLPKEERHAPRAAL